MSLRISEFLRLKARSLQSEWLDHAKAVGAAVKISVSTLATVGIMRYLIQKSRERWLLGQAGLSPPLLGMTN
jgi:post-segregation antitoxin (ccd killing protein)